MKQIAKSYSKRPDYIVFDNLSEFEFYKRWGYRQMLINIFKNSC